MPAYLKKEILIVQIKKKLIYKMSLLYLKKLFQIIATVINQMEHIIRNIQLFLENLEVFQTRVTMIKSMTFQKPLYLELNQRIIYRMNHL